MKGIITSSAEAILTERNSRRDFLKKTVIAGAAIAFPNILLARNTDKYVKKLSFYHITTGEFVNAKFWENGEYNVDELSKIYYIMRDFHVNKETIIDINLIELLSSMHRTSNSIFPFYLNSGYRTTETNERVGGAENSFHMKGQASDILLPRFKLSDLKDIALSKRAGGVGYYPSQNFLHVDVGNFRTWAAT